MIFTWGVPVTEQPVTVVVSQIVPDPLQAILPVPNAMVRVDELDEENIPVVKVLPLRSSVPEVRVNVLVEANVNASARRTVAPDVIDIGPS